MDFDLNALSNALDERRRALGMSWAEVSHEINLGQMGGRLLATSTIAGIQDKAQAEGNGVLQMLLWLGRTPESFVPGVTDADAEHFRLPEPGTKQVLRWDAKALYAALNTQRQAHGMTWQDAAQEIGGFTPGMLTHLAKGGRVGFPRVMRIVRWIAQPAAAFTRLSDR